MARAGADGRTVLGFIHQDTRLHFDFRSVVPHYFSTLDRAGVVGFLGTDEMTTDGCWWAGGTCYGGLMQGEVNPAEYRYLPVRGHQPVEAVDGYCLFVRRDVFHDTGGFDERFDHWHFYDVDLCLSAHRRGYRNYVIDQKTQHFSPGSYDAEWRCQREKYLAKWGDYLNERKSLPLHVPRQDPMRDAPQPGPTPAGDHDRVEFGPSGPGTPRPERVRAHGSRSMAELESYIVRAGTDDEDVFGGPRGEYLIQQNPKELAQLVYFLRETAPPLRWYCEIGVAAAGMTRLVHELVGFEQALLIDDGLHHHHDRMGANIAAFRSKCRIFEGDSHSLACRRFVARELEGAKIDLVLVDGDHSFEGVQGDLELLLPFLGPQSILLFHDIATRHFHVGDFWMRCESLERVAEFIDACCPLGIGVARLKHAF